MSNERVSLPATPRWQLNAADFTEARKLAREWATLSVGGGLSSSLTVDKFPLLCRAFLDLENARQYHMSEITRLQMALGVEGLTSEQVVDLALERIAARSETASVNEQVRAALEACLTYGGGSNWQEIEAKARAALKNAAPRHGGETAITSASQEAPAREHAAVAASALPTETVPDYLNRDLEWP